MADSTTPLDLISVGQATKEATANALFDAASPSMLFGRRASTSTGLTWGYYGGRYNSTLLANGTLALTASTTNYIVAEVATGTLSVSTAITNWNNTAAYIRLYRVVTGTLAPTSWEDHRQVIYPWPGVVPSSSGGFQPLVYRFTLIGQALPPSVFDYT